MLNKRILFALLFLVFFFCSASAATYYVDKANSNCADSKPGTEAEPWCTIAKATATAIAGDTVLIKAGEYKEILKPAHSGTAGNPITFKSYVNREAIIKDIASYDARTLLHPSDPYPYYGPIWLEDLNYIVIDGLTLTNTYGYIRAVHSNNNIIKNCDFRDSSSGHTKGAGAYFFESNNNRIENNIINDTRGDNMAFTHSNGNVVQNNTFRKGGHVLLTIKCGSNNVVRNNYFYNEIQKIMEVLDCEQPTMFWHGNVPYYQDTAITNSVKYNLIEGNEFAFTAAASTSPYNGIQHSAQHSIIRQNVFYENIGGAIGLQMYGGDEAEYNTYNRIYNNVFYKNHFGAIIVSSGTEEKMFGNVFKNNIIYKNDYVRTDFRTPPRWHTYLDGLPIQVLFSRYGGFKFEKNSILNQSQGEPIINYYDGSNHQYSVSELEAHPSGIFSGNIEAEPNFVNAAGHDFHLALGSSMVDAGAFLTKATNSGSGSVLLQVEDAGYFFDGFGIPGESADVVQLEGSSETALIASIDYAANAITLANPLSWEAGQGVSLAFKGNAPDIGAFESDGEGQPPAACTMAQLLAYISQWKQGGLSMQVLMQKIVQWKAGTGC